MSSTYWCVYYLLDGSVVEEVRFASSDEAIDFVLAHADTLADLVEERDEGTDELTGSWDSVSRRVGPWQAG